MKKRDLNEIAKIEKAIKEKYGQEAIQNPKSGWTKDKESKYLQDLRKFYKDSKQESTIEVEDGFTVKIKKKNIDKIDTCPVCFSRCTALDDDICMLKYDCCFECYIQYVENREDRWNSGWRPNQ